MKISANWRRGIDITLFVAFSSIIGLHLHDPQGPLNYILLILFGANALIFLFFTCKEWKVDIEKLDSADWEVERVVIALWGSIVICAAFLNLRYGFEKANSYLTGIAHLLIPLIVINPIIWVLGPGWDRLLLAPQSDARETGSPEKMKTSVDTASAGVLVKVSEEQDSTGDTTIVLTVADTKTGELPKASRLGTWGFAAAGLLICGVAAAVAVRRK